MHLDQVFGLAAGREDIVVEMAGFASESGDDITGIEAACCVRAEHGFPGDLEAAGFEQCAERENSLSADDPPAS